MQKRRVAALAVLILLAQPVMAVAVAQEQGRETFVVRRGHYLWHEWNTPTVQEQYPNWREYWAEASRINDIPMTHAAWKRLADGRVIEKPGTVATLADSTRNRLEETVARLNRELMDAKQAATAAAQDAQRRLAQVDEQILKSVPDWVVYTWLVGLLALLGLAMLFTSHMRGRKEIVELRRLRDEAYISWNAPEDWEPIEEGTSRTIYFRRNPMQPLTVDKNDVEVYAMGRPQFIRFGNLMTRFNEADDRAIEAYGFRRKPIILNEEDVVEEVEEERYAVRNR